MPHSTDVVLAVGDVGLDLLQGAPRQEGSGATDEGDEARAGQAGTDTDHVLLGDPHVDQPLGVSVPEPHEVARADRVVAHRQDPRVRGSQLDQRVGEHGAVVVGREFVDGGHDASSNSRSACRTWSAFGTL